MPTRPPRSGPRTAVILLLLALVLSACSGDSDDPADPESSAARPSASSDVSTRVTLGKVTGKLAKADRKRLLAAVGDVVDGWFDAAYVSGDYPRTKFSDSFPGFTSGARADARRDRALMSNQSIGKRIDGASATRRRVRVDALVVDGRAVGATARVILRYRTTGTVQRKFEVRGRLLLTRQDGWKVFGYDITREAAR